MEYQPIENYGIIGNMRTVALTGTNGSIDWFCYPNFDSPSVFASILDNEKGGYFLIQPNDTSFTSKQFYWPDTNVLVTRFLTDEGVCEITDYMPVGASGIGDGENRLVRRVHCVRGHIRLNVECAPAFNYGREKHTVKINDHGASFYTSNLSLALATSEDLQHSDGKVSVKLFLKEGESANFVIKEIQEGELCDECYSEEEAHDGFKVTVRFWRDWLKQSTYKGRWREMVNRSALTLKLLTFEPTGAIVAAPTTSLPEGIGGERNWDYRYTWIRDASFTVYAFMRIGFNEEAEKFMEWIEARVKELVNAGPMQIMYGIDGRHELTEEHLDHLKGYRNSAPVRIGNGAYDQLQLDIYGELMDSVYLYNKYGTPISYDLWVYLRKLINWLADNWQQRDEGIWEVRGGQQHFVYSRLMSWVAFDRAIRLADKRSFPADHQKWIAVRDTIYEEIMDKGWNSEIQAFVQSYNSDSLDASNLLMPLVFFVSPKDERMQKTLDAINKSPQEGGLVSDGLVYRYKLK